MLKDQLKACEPVAGMHICLSSPSMTELCAQIGYDFLWIETEHSPTGYQGVLNHLIAASSGGTECVVRVPWNDEVLAKRVLEMGPAGIMFPMVSTQKECEKAMAATLYPPLGTRGFGPQRAIRHGLDDAAEYVKKTSLNMVRIVQIESAECVEKELEAMLDNEWVDCFMLGPCDLSATMGLLPDIDAPKSVAMQDRALKKIRDAGKSAGTSIGIGDAESIRRWRDRGANVVCCGSESSHILSGASRTLRSLKGEGPQTGKAAAV